MRSLMAVMALVLAGEAAGLHAAGLPIDTSWSADPIWDDGLAEVAHYDAHRTVYGLDRSFETILITVKEDFDRALSVKADPPFGQREIVTVLKLNVVSTIPTQNYPYHYMTSVFVLRDDPRSLVKIAQSSQEWCGATFKEVLARAGRTRLLFHSYFDGQADGDHPMPLDESTLVEEQLLVLARALRLEPGTRHAARLYETLVTNAVKAPAAGPVALLSAGESRVETPAGVFQADRIDVVGESGAGSPRMSFWLERSPRRALLKMETADGRSLLLRRISRRDYWSR